jgi:hypothetical protein
LILALFSGSLQEENELSFEQSFKKPDSCPNTRIQMFVTADIKGVQSKMQNLLSRVQQTGRGEFQLRLFFWLCGLILATLQVWSYRFYMTADAISYLDMSDAVMPGNAWGKLITGVWSPLYPFLVGIGRRLIRPSPLREVVVAHYFNLFFLIFALLCFEFLMRVLLDEHNQEAGTHACLLPRWAILSLGYTLFFWASLSQITLQTLRADMLMSGFAYLVLGLLLRLRNTEANWQIYGALGAAIGIGYLTKAAMLPFGFLALAGSFFLVNNWRRAVLPALAAGLLALIFGSAYYYPLSHLRGHFTLGESSDFNYLYHVNRAGPTWYIQDLGGGTGKLQRVPQKVSETPPAYVFSFPYRVTHPLRFDPAYWTQGAHPRFRLRSQYAAIRENLHILGPILEATGGLVAAFVILLFVAPHPKGFIHLWPLWVLGIAGIAMYDLVHVENRYVGVFFVFLWLGLISALRPGTEMSNRIVSGLVLGIVFSLFIPILEDITYDFSKALHQKNEVNLQAAVELHKLGICEGDRVARISPLVTDLMWARATRTMVVAEVDYGLTYQFWQQDAEVRAQVLRSMASSGAKIVVAHVPGEIVVPPGWQRLGSTPHYFQPLVENPFTCKAASSQ